MTSVASHPGSCSTGNITGDRKTSGNISRFITAWNASMLFIREPSSSPSEVSDRDSTSISPTSMKPLPTEISTSAKGMNTSISSPWKMAMVAPPSALPTATEVRLMGATSTSLRKPNSRSNTTVTPDITEPKMTTMAMMPGYMKAI